MNGCLRDAELSAGLNHNSSAFGFSRYRVISQSQSFSGRRNG